MSWQCRIIQNLKRNWLVISKLTWELWQILTWTFKSLRHLHFKGPLLTKVYDVWVKKVQKVTNRPLPCWHQYSLLLTSLAICPEIYNRTYVRQCLFVRRSDKQQRRVRLFQISQKERIFHHFWQLSALGANLTICSFLLALSKKGLPFPSNLTRNEIYLGTHLKQELTDLFWKLPRVFPISTQAQ